MHTGEVNIGGQPLTIETGKLAKQADGSVVVRYGDTMVLVTACYSPHEREGIDFLPLTVDYRENTYASGRIPGGFFKREGKPPEKEVLTSRGIDRPIRPLFPAGWRHETQVVAFVISADTDNDSDVLALTGASAALALSEIPFARTIAAVRVGLLDGELLINPTYDQRQTGSVGPRGGRQQGRAGHGRSGRQGGLRGRDASRAQRGSRSDPGDRRRDRHAGGRRWQTQADDRREVTGRRLRQGGRGPGAGPARCRDACARQAGELRGRRPGARRVSGDAAPGRCRTPRRCEERVQGAEGEGAT